MRFKDRFFAGRGSRLGIGASMALTVLGLTAACSKASDPKAITIDELKNPGGLVVRDDGNGAATLFWVGTNNEEDFDGYNIYGMKATTENGLGNLDGTSLQLLTEEGDAVEEARAALAKFNYSPADGYKFEQKGTKEDSEKEFSALPVHTLDGDKPLLPTCKNNGTKDSATGAYGCANTTKDNVGQDVDDNSAYSANGLMSYAVSGLTPGQKYCFLVMSSIDEGKKVSQASTNVACFVPKKAFTLSVAMPDDTDDRLIMDLSQLVTKCATDCTAPTVGSSATGILYAGVKAEVDFKKNVYVEWTESGSSLAIFSGIHNGIQNLGYYKNGFKDKTLPPRAPKLTLGEPSINNDQKSIIRNLSGYSIVDQSILLLKHHMYVIAVADASTTTAPTEHSYIWLWVSGDPSKGSTPAIEVRVPMGTNQF